jgi:hypothetical protein
MISILLLDEYLPRNSHSAQSCLKAMRSEFFDAPIPEDQEIVFH